MISLKKVTGHVLEFLADETDRQARTTGGPKKYHSRGNSVRSSPYTVQVSDLLPGCEQLTLDRDNILRTQCRLHLVESRRDNGNMISTRQSTKHRPLLTEEPKPKNNHCSSLRNDLLKRKRLRYVYTYVVH